VIEAPALLPGGDVDVVGEELGVLEGLEAVEADRLLDARLREELSMEDQAVAGGPGQVQGDGGVGNPLGPGDLADPGTGDGLADDVQEQVVAMEPVGGGEGAGGEGPAAVEAAVASERLGRGWRVIEAPMAVVPEGRGFVEGAVAVGTVRKACGRAEGERPRRFGPLATSTAG